MQESYPPTQQFTAPKAHYTRFSHFSQLGISRGLVCALVSGVGIVMPCAAFVVSRSPSKAPGARESDPGGNTVETNK